MSDGPQPVTQQANVYIGVSLFLVHAAPGISFFIHLDRLIGGTQDSLWAVFGHSTVIEKSQVVAVTFEPRVLQDTAKAR